MAARVAAVSEAIIRSTLTRTSSATSSEYSSSRPATRPGAWARYRLGSRRRLPRGSLRYDWVLPCRGRPRRDQDMTSRLRLTLVLYVVTALLPVRGVAMTSEIGDPLRFLAVASGIAYA